MITVLCFTWRFVLGYQLVFMAIPIGARIEALPHDQVEGLLA